MQLVREESEFGTKLTHVVDNLKTNIEDGLKREILVYTRPLTTADDLKFRIETSDSFEIAKGNERLMDVVLRTQLLTDKQLFPEGVYRESWKEFVLRQRRGQGETNPFDLRFEVSTSYRAQQLRILNGTDGITNEKAVATGELFNSIEGVIVTSDERIIYGVRGGDYKKGLLHVVPTGSMSPPTNEGHPVFESFYSELKEELGITRDKIVRVKWIARQTDPHATAGIHHIVTGEVEETAQELVDKHANAFSIYESAKDKVMKKWERMNLTDADRKKVLHEADLEARAVLKANSDMPDAWEHSRLIALTPNLIEDAVLTRRVKYNGGEYNVLPTGAGILIAVNEYIKK